MALAKKLFFGLLLCGVLHAQNPRGISYQGVVLYPSVELPGIDSRVTPYSERDVCFRFSIYDDTDALEYSETHNTSTDYYGQVNLVIGRGDNPLIPGRLDDLKWDGTAKFLKVELDYAALCTDWEEISYSELNYVPFAFYALSSGGSNSDDQNLTGATLTGTTLQIDIENGNSTSVDLATLQDGTGTDDQNIQGLVLDATTNTLTVGIENGTSQNVDLSSLAGADNQNLTAATLTGTTLQIDIENGNSTSVDLVALQDGTGTDDQNLTAATLTGTTLQIDIENGNSTSVDLVALQDGTGTDDQNLTAATLTGTTLQIDIENGNSTSVDLAALQDGTGTDDQNLTAATLTGTTLQIDIENGNSTSVDLVALQDGTGTDDQNIQGLVLDATTSTLTVGIENGTSQNVSLAALVNDADANPTNEIQDLILTTKILSITNNTAATPIDLKEVLDLNDAADVTITAPATNEVLAYESGQWVNKPLKDLKLVEYASSYPAAPQSQPLKVGLPSSPNSTDLRFANIDEVDILIIDNSSDNSYITLEDLDSERDGKILKIVESSNQNPKITANSIPFYNTLDADNENYLFFNFIKIVTSGGDLNREFKHESVDFIWQGGNWTPMR